jgi:hypothetical protein
MRFRFWKYFPILAVLALASSLWAKTRTVDLQITEPSMIATTMLQPGEYHLKVDDATNQISVEQHGEVIAQVPFHWIQLQSKADQTAVTFSSNQIVEIDFDGDMQAARL